MEHIKQAWITWKLVIVEGYNGKLLKDCLFAHLNGYEDFGRRGW